MAQKFLIGLLIDSGRTGINPSKLPIGISKEQIVVIRTCIEKRERGANRA